MQQRARGGIEPMAAAARTQPLYLGCPVAQLVGQPSGSFIQTLYYHFSRGIV